MTAKDTGKHCKIRQGRNGTGDGRGNCHGQGIAVFNMGQFMGHDPGNLIAVQKLEQSGGCRHRRIFRITSGGKGIGLWIFNHIDLGHWQTGILRQFTHHRNQFRCRAVIDLAGASHPKQHRIRIPIGKHVHRTSKKQGDDHALLPANHHADHAKQRGQPGE